MIYKILDYITQYFCSHSRKWLSSQEYNSNDANLHTIEIHCFRCGKKRIQKCNYTGTVTQKNELSFTTIQQLLEINF